jgi:uncharacterized coiled-coil protein SlyX
MMGARLEQIESKIAHLENANAELSAELIHQQRVIAELRSTLAALTERLEARKGDATQWSSAEERPPHY